MKIVLFVVISTFFSNAHADQKSEGLQKFQLAAVQNQIGQALKTLEAAKTGGLNFGGHVEKAEALLKQAYEELNRAALAPQKK